MSGKARAAFHAVPRIVKVGKQDEPPDCLKWKPGLFFQEGKVCKICEKECLEDAIPNEKIQRSELRSNEVSTIPENCSCFCEEDSCFETDELTRNSLTEEEWQLFALYLSKTRININVRQVHELGKTVQN